MIRTTMRCLTYFLLLCLAPINIAASSWGFEDASISIHNKKAGVGGGLKEKYVRLLCFRADLLMHFTHPGFRRTSHWSTLFHWEPRTRSRSYLPQKTVARQNALTRPSYNCLIPRVTLKHHLCFRSRRAEKANWSWYSWNSCSNHG